MQQMPGEGRAQQFGVGGSGGAAAAGWHASLGLGGSGGTAAMQQMPDWGGADFDAVLQTIGVDLSSSQSGASTMRRLRKQKLVEKRERGGLSSQRETEPSASNKRPCGVRGAPGTSKKCGGCGHPILGSRELHRKGADGGCIGFSCVKCGLPADGAHNTRGCEGA